MAIVAARDERAQPRPIRKPPSLPRPPKSWTYDPQRGELHIVDCNDKPATYRVLELACDFGRAWELISVDERFGECRTVHVDGEDCQCDCPGGTYRGVCKHLTCLLSLTAGGAL